MTTKNAESYTVGCANTCLGTYTYCGTFPTKDEAKAYARRQNLLTRDWNRHTVYEGTPDHPRRKVCDVPRD